MILAGDLGGTKTNLALFPPEGELTPLAQAKFSSEDYSGLEPIVREFLASTASRASREIRAAVFGLAGPIRGDVGEITNLPWVIQGRRVGEKTGIDQVKLINDLEATGYGVAALSEDELVVLNQGSPDPEGHGAIIAAGTGLGEAFLFRHQGEFIPVASEGGHSTFSPRNELEIELLRYLLGRWSHVSFERVVSGQGVHNIYRFFRDTGRGEEPSWLREKLAQGDPAAVIAETASGSQSELCQMTMDLFVQLYGVEAGNLALKCKAVGGLYVGGGIAPKILDWLQNGLFLEAFASKGRLSDLVADIPVKVILNPKTALLGAARCARLLLQA